MLASRMFKKALLNVSLTSLVSAQSLSLLPLGDQIQLQWDRQFPADTGVSSWQEYRILTSDDLSRWTEQTMIRVDDSQGAGISLLDLPRQDGRQFFQLESQLFYTHRAEAGAQPAIYDGQYDFAYNPSLSSAQFTQQLQDPAEISQIGWDPTTANYFAIYNSTPAEHNSLLAPDDPERRIYDFSLNETELAKFQENGFVVSPRVMVFDDLSYSMPHVVAPTPVDLYYAIWTDDLPVFITADSVLDAWHQSFASIFEELDEIAVYPALKKLVVNDWDAAFALTTAPWNPALGTEQENANVQDAIDLVTFYIDVAQGLLNTEVPTSSPLAVEWYQAVANPDPNVDIKLDLYGDADRFSRPNLFTPRGRFTRSAALSAYFRAFTWLSRAQFHIAHSTLPDLTQRNRELRASALLALTIRDGDLLDDWSAIESMLQGVAGQSDAMTIPEMIALLEDNSLDNIASIASDTGIASLRAALLASTYGIQEINGGYYEPDGVCNPSDLEQHRALSLFGQRWTPDAWTFQKVVFPEVRDENDNAAFRRLPSGLDVAYAALSNEAAGSILMDRMADAAGVSFRDGIPYQQNLDATRAALDSQEEAFWTEHLYGRWMFGLRSLSEPLSASAPDTFRTTAWKHRILNTQLASWTQLRHDTLLFAKQSFTPPVACEYPDGYVDPYPELWQRLSDISLAYRSFIDDLELEGSFGIESESFYDYYAALPTNTFTPTEGYPHSLITSDPEIYQNRIRQIDRGERLAAMSAHLANFSSRCLSLKAIAENQLAGQSHTPEMSQFIENTVEDFSLLGYVGDRLYNGWFPGLYFENYRQQESEHPSSTWNPVVVDVHTDARDACSGDPGSILHVGTGRTQFMLTAVQHPDGTACAYGGPIMSQYEFTEPLGTRLTNERWMETLNLEEEPDLAPWKNSFMVPYEKE